MLNVAAPGVLADDTDPDSDSLTAGMPTNPAQGRLVLNSDGSFIYTPTAGYTGTDSFTYMAHDGRSPKGAPGSQRPRFHRQAHGRHDRYLHGVELHRNGTAMAASDYTAITDKTLTFAPGVAP